MIPVRLTVENFKCYRQNVPPLHLGGIHIACLTGANGHGKSSLLDAIAWALWGDAVHRPQEELVHTGEQDMRVELEFIAEGRSYGEGQGQLYRVIRRYSRGRGARAGSTDLQLQIAASSPNLATSISPTDQMADNASADADPSGASKVAAEQSAAALLDVEDAMGTRWREVGESTVRETEAAIRRLVRMNYDTFVNSAFLVQGRANEFTTKRPADRQRVLGEILGLNFYERLMDRARRKVREISAESRLLEGQLQAWSQHLEQRGEHEVQLPEAQSKLATSSGALKQAEELTNSLRGQAESLRARRKELEDLSSRVVSESEELRQLRELTSLHSRQISEWEKLSKRREAIQEAYRRLTEARLREQEASQRQVPFVRLQERMRPLEQRAGTLVALETDITAVEQEHSTLDEREEALESKRLELQSLQVQEQTLTTDNQRLRSEMLALRGKVDMLSKGEAKCPLCGTDLGEQGKEHIQAEYESQGRVLAQQYRQNEATLAQSSPRLKEIAANVAGESESLQQAKRTLLVRLAALKQQMDEAQRAPQQLEDIHREMADLGYDPEAHQRHKEEIERLLPSENEYRMLEQAENALPEEREKLSRVVASATRREEEIAQGEQQIESIRKEIASLDELERQYATAEAQRRSTQEEYQSLMGRVQHLELMLKQYAETDLRRMEAQVKLKGLSEKRELYEQLVTAFGRTGVQALLVESALPELEAEANRLLGRMTDNAMHLTLQTQRLPQRGEPVETLEIKVADTLGTRSYETFSGGEAFRINLALRIALSKLLAQRSGAPLPTLFIDEGFGTQDTTGRERVLDVIQSIADDFERILVITHMDEMKDSFPVRIEVEKRDDGSTFAIT